MDAWREAVIKEARSWIGTPFQHKARVKGVGCDCGGLVYSCFAPLVSLPAFPASYAPDWSLHKDGNELYLDFIKPYVIEVRRPVPGGITIFQFGRNFGHAAIYTDRETYIHAWGRTGEGCVKEDRPPFFNMPDGKRRLAKHFDAKV